MRGSKSGGGDENGDGENLGTPSRKQRKEHSTGTTRTTNNHSSTTAELTQANSGEYNVNKSPRRRQNIPRVQHDEYATVQDSPVVNRKQWKQRQEDVSSWVRGGFLEGDKGKMASGKLQPSMDTYRSSTENSPRASSSRSQQSSVYASYEGTPILRAREHHNQSINSRQIQYEETDAHMLLQQQQLKQQQAELQTYGYLHGSPKSNQKSAAGVAIPSVQQLSTTTRERLLASQSGGSPVTSPYMKTRSKKRSRHQSSGKSSGTGGISDSNELLAGGGQPDYTNWNMMDWAAAHNGLDVNNQLRGKDSVRTANSLESLDSVSSCIQQARANSFAKKGDSGYVFTKINRSNSVSTRIGDGSQDFPRSASNIRNKLGESEYYGVPITRHSEPQQQDGTNSRLSNRSLYSQIAEDDGTRKEILKLRRDLREEQSKVQRLNSQLSTNAQVVSAFEQSLANMNSRLQHLTKSAEEKDRELQELYRTIEQLRLQGNQLEHNNHQNNQQTNGNNGTPKKGGGSVDCLMSGPRNGAWIHHDDSDNDDGSNIRRKTFSFKNRKSKWFQKSLSKAFSRTRKTQDQERRDTHGFVDIGTSCPPSPCRGHHRSRSAPILDVGEDVEELKNQLNLKETLLTETRLEALSSAHQLQSLRETVAKLRNEMVTIQKENALLLGKNISIEPSASPPVVESSSSISVLSSSIPSLQRANMSPMGSRFSSQLQLQQNQQDSTSFSSSHNQDQMNRLAGTASMERHLTGGGSRDPKFGGPVNTWSAGRRLTVRGHGSPGGISACGGGNDSLFVGSVERKGRRSRPSPAYSESPIRRPLGSAAAARFNEDVKTSSNLIVSCAKDMDVEQVSIPVSVISAGSARRNESKIGYISISKHSSWISLDDAIRCLVKLYLSRLDPDNSLDLGPHSIVWYQCGNYRRFLKTTEPEGNPSPLPETRIWVYLRSGRDRGSLDDLAFTTLYPQVLLKQFSQRLGKYEKCVLVGHPEVGKSYLARKLAEFLILKSGQDLCLEQMRILWTNKWSVQECIDLLGDLKVTEKEDKSKSRPTVIILENIHAQDSRILHIFSESRINTDKYPLMICTSEPTPHVRDVCTRYGFAEFSIGEDVEFVQGFLSRFLRRKLLSLEVATRTQNQSTIEAIQWILRIFCNLFIFVKTTSKGGLSLSPKEFLSCPVDSSQSLRCWFINLWNENLVPYLRKVVSSREDPSEFEDPVRFVIRTWPWDRHSSDISQVLLAVKSDNHQGSEEDWKLEDGGQEQQETDQRISRAESSPRHTQDPRVSLESTGAIDTSKQYDNNSDDPLMSMLICLQEAAQYNPTNGK